MRRLLVLTAFLLCFLQSSPAFAQSSNANLGGTVSDATGALIPGVNVTATNTATGIVSTGISNESGAYQFPSLQPGAYTVSAELPGFQTQTYTNVALGVSGQVRLNFSLQVASVATAVEVTIAADSLLSTTSASVGTVLPEYKVRDLPLGSRNVNDLIYLTAGTGPDETGIRGNFASGRISAVNITLDGLVVTNGRYNQGTFAATYVSPDLVEEVRVMTATVDAEAGRGSGQVQMATRAGTNQVRGAVFWTNQNSALDAASWFNNFSNTVANWENRNQFGGRIGGPIVRNKTFFFFLVEEQRDVTKSTVVGSVLTPLARQGIFRFYPGANNGNITTNAPTVDTQGNPVRPAGATGDLQQFNVFTLPNGQVRDPLRPGFDPTGYIQSNFLGKMPLPNDYTIGDGLNTAGIRWTRRVSGSDAADGNSYDQNNRDQINFRIDHNFNSSHKAGFTHTWERGLNHTGQAGLRNWPNGYDGTNQKFPRLYNATLVSTLSPSMVNELRIGLRRTAIYSLAPFFVGRRDGDPLNPAPIGPEAEEPSALLLRKNGYVIQPSSQLMNGLMNWGAGFGSTRGSISPLWSYADTLSWTKGKHALRMGGEFRRDRSNGWNDNSLTPHVNFGEAVGFPVANLDATAIPGLTASNQTLARQMVTDFSGSINTIVQGYDLIDPKKLVFEGQVDGQILHYRDWRANEWSIFFKDDWKVSPSVTLNLGAHWEWFGVPFEGRGLAGRPTGGQKGLCGISCGPLTSVEFVGKNSPQPDKALGPDDWNNIAPAVGLSWSLPWLGQDKTVLRLGYGWSYTGRAIAGVPGGIDATAGAVPGTFEGSGGSGLTYRPTTFENLTNYRVPIPHQFAPLSTSAIDGARSYSIAAFADDRVAPYIQNFNLEIQRELMNNMTLQVAYVGTKGTKLFGGIPVNVANIYASQGGESLLDAFNTTRAGGNSALFDRMLMGLTIPGTTGAVNGTTVRGSAALRAWTGTGSTRASIATGAVGTFVQLLNNSTLVGGAGGGIIRNSGLFPETWIVTNPQFSGVTSHENPSNSTYHSLQTTLTRRLANGVSNQTSYTWSRSLGLADGDGGISPRDPNNRFADKQLLGFHRTHTFTSNGTFELPFGPGRPILPGATGLVRRLVERWQIGAIFSWNSGSPLDMTGTGSTTWQSTPGLVDIVGDFPKSTGKVTMTNSFPIYFPGLTQIPDPAIAGVSTLNGLSSAVTGNFFAIADAQGRPLLSNVGPGKVSNMGFGWIEGPSSIGLDVNLIKRMAITESKTFEIRVDATNVLNHPNFGAPNTNINSTTFGRITSASGARRFTLAARLDF